MSVVFCFFIPTEKHVWAKGLAHALDILSAHFAALPFTSAIIQDKEQVIDRPETFYELISKFKSKSQRLDFSNSSSITNASKTGPIRDEYISLIATIEHGFEPVTYKKIEGTEIGVVTFQCPLSKIHHIEQLFIELSEALNSIVAYYLPSVSSGLLHDYRRSMITSLPSDLHDACVSASREFVVLLNQCTQDLPDWPQMPTWKDIERPRDLGWLNYWSARTCWYVGFPDEALDAELMLISYKTKNGAWLVKLGEEPLDFTKRDHVQLYTKTYRRFNKVGLI